MKVRGDFLGPPRSTDKTTLIIKVMEGDCTHNPEDWKNKSIKYSLFVGQLYEDKSLKLHARDLIFFTTDLQTINYYSTIHC